MMNEREIAEHITSLQTRMNRMETLMQQLLSTLTDSRANVEKTIQMQNLLQDLRLDPNMHTLNTSTINPGVVTSQERPEIGAIRQALLAGNKIKAIQLYRSLYGVGLKEAQKALDAM